MILSQLVVLVVIIGGTTTMGHCAVRMTGDRAQVHKTLIMIGEATNRSINGEHLEREHLLPAANETGSGIPVCCWLRRVLLVANKLCGWTCLVLARFSVMRTTCR
jgi:hypothetical protein